MDDDQRLREALRECWDGLGNRDGEDWVSRGFATLAKASEGTRLRELFVFTSHSSVHLSRCSDFVFVVSFPWISFDHGGSYWVWRRSPGDWTGWVPTGDETLILETTSATDAVRAVADELSADLGPVWIGSAEDRPSGRGGPGINMGAS